MTGRCCPAFRGRVAGDGPPIERAAEALDETFAFRRRQWAGEGFAPIRADWLDCAAGRGQSMRVNTPGGVIEGVFEDLDLSGALILNSNGERRAVAAGAVLPPQAAERSEMSRK